MFPPAGRPETGFPTVASASWAPMSSVRTGSLRTMSGFGKQRLDRLADVMARHVSGGAVPGLVTAGSRGAELHGDAIGTTPFEAGRPMARDSIFRISSMTKPVTAVAILILVEECRLRLDEPVSRLLPELAEVRVLRRPDAEITDTVPAERAITVRDLLTFTWGSGQVSAPRGTRPIQARMEERLGRTGPPQPAWAPGPDAWISALATLPLIHQPGAGWMY